MKYYLVAAVGDGTYSCPPPPFSWFVGHNTGTSGLSGAAVARTGRRRRLAALIPKPFEEGPLED